MFAALLHSRTGGGVKKLVPHIDINGESYRIDQQGIKGGVAQLVVQLNGRGLTRPTTIAHASSALSVSPLKNIENLIASLKLVNGVQT